MLWPLSLPRVPVMTLSYLDRPPIAPAMGRSWKRHWRMEIFESECGDTIKKMKVSWIRYPRLPDPTLLTLIGLTLYINIKRRRAKRYNGFEVIAGLALVYRDSCGEVQWLQPFDNVESSCLHHACDVVFVLAFACISSMDSDMRRRCMLPHFYVTSRGTELFFA